MAGETDFEGALGKCGSYTLNLDHTPALPECTGLSAAVEGRAWISRSHSTVSEPLKDEDFPVQLARLFTVRFFAPGIG